MYTILVNSDDTLRTTTKEIIYHRSSLVRSLRFLVDPIYYDDSNNGQDMKSYVCTLEYKLPISDKYVPVILTPSENLYKNKLEYLLPIDTAITSEVGEVELKLNFMKLEMGADGIFKERVRKTGSAYLTITPTAQWSDYVADGELDNIAQMILTMQSQNEQLKSYAEQIKTLGQAFMVTKADNITYDESTNKIQLKSMGTPIGDSVEIKQDCEDGVPVVDFSVITPDEPEGEEVDNVVEF